MPTQIPNDMDLFRGDLNKGRLMFVEEDERSRFKFTIWFDYTRQMFNSIKEGDILAIQNFATDRNGTKWSLIEVTSILPYHFALGADKRDLKRGYPGFTSEAAKNLSTDWVEQEDTPLDDTTKITCTATPLNREIFESRNQRILRRESAMPMVGFDVETLSDDLTEFVFNEGLDPNNAEDITIGTLLRSELRGRPINILLNLDSFIKTHFGLFGFTGVGKSNLVSTVVTHILSGNVNSTDSLEPQKVVLFDLMDEYKTLLIDQILELDGNVRIVCLGERTLPGDAFEYLNTPPEERTEEQLESAMGAIHRQSLLPRTLRDRRDDFRPLIRELLTENLIWMFNPVEEEMTVQDFVEQHHEDFFHEKMHVFTVQQIENAIDQCFTPLANRALTPEVAEQIHNNLQEYIREHTEEEGDEMMVLPNSAVKRLRAIAMILGRIANIQEEEDIEAHWSMTMGEMIRELNDRHSTILYIIISHDNDEVRLFANRFGMALYESRRRRGTNTPLITLIFDEADEFIPGEPRGTQAVSKRIIEQLARRGRKFGIGVGIATQRIAYMDTNIMGQLHTYFISKLPRKYDRDTVGEAFSLSEEVFKQTFKFAKGDWLLVSHEATGQESTPVPIHTFNAEQRLRNYIDNRNSREE